MRQSFFDVSGIRLALLFALGSVVLTLAGCNGSMPGVTMPQPAGIQGRVHGGQPAVQGATIQLYAANTTAYAGPATPMLTTTVTTNNFGGFTITGDYSCPSPTAQVYLVATGGNPGLAPGTNNTGIAMMAALGDCGNLSSATYIDIDEVSTVAAVFGLAPFMTVGEGANLGTSSSNTQGLANAFATVTNLLVDTSRGHGTSPGPNVPAGATVPSDEIHALADILSSCINSTDAASAGCTALFNAANPGSTQPNNTIDAALLIAQNPAHNVATLYGLIPASPPFATALASPNDWTVSVKYTAGGLNQPQGIAVDGSGNVWVANTAASTAVKYSPIGVLLSGTGFGSGTLNFPWALAIDASGNAWVADTGHNQVVELDKTTGAVVGTPLTGNGLNFDMAIAVDASGSLWMVNSDGPFCCDDGSVTKFTSLLSGSGPFTGGGLSGHGWESPNGIAVDGSGNIWISDYIGGYDGVSICCGGITELDSSGTAISPSRGYTNGGAGDQRPQGIAIGASGTVWTANGFASVTGLNISDASAVSGSPFTATQLNNPQGIAVDGLGSIWVTNNGGNSLSEFSKTGAAISPDATNGYGSGSGLSNPWAIAIDGSGNVWVTNQTGNSVTEFVGIAAPTVTPIATQAVNNTFGTLP